MSKPPPAAPSNGAERELSIHPDNTRAAYLGAKALAKEWLDRSLTTDPDDVLTQYNVACTYTALGDRAIRKFSS